MSKITKQDILDAIRQTAKENGGVPLGMGRFEKETGISLYDTQSYWSTFGEAQREAGFAPNTLQVPHNEEFLFESLIALMREIGRFPTRADLVVKRKKDTKFPSPSSIHRRYGEKNKLLKKYLRTQRKKDITILLNYVRRLLKILMKKKIQIIPKFKH